MRHWGVNYYHLYSLTIPDQIMYAVYILGLQLHARNLPNRYVRPCSDFFVFVFVVLGPHLWHMEVPRLGVPLELQWLVYTTATVTPDLIHIFDLHHSSRQ